MPRAVIAARTKRPLSSVEIVPMYFVRSPSVEHAARTVAVWPPGERSTRLMRSFDRSPDGCG
jgi:hypothetical protein